MNPRLILRPLRRSFAGAPIVESPIGRVGIQFDRARMVVKGYYLLSIYFSAAAIPTLHDTAIAAPSWNFLWPVRWMPAGGVAGMVDLLAAAWLTLSLLAFVFTGSRAIRALFALATLQVAAAANSLGGINHAYHAWFWIGAFLVFLPAVAEVNRRATMMTYLAIVAGCQVLLLTFYTMAGFQKFGAGAAALGMGAYGNFSPTSLAATIADRILQTGTSPPLAHLLVDNPWLSLPLFVPAIVIQMLAVIAGFRPRLHRAWGAAIIVFHLGTWLLMEILFVQHVALLALFLLASPFAPARFDWKATLSDVPLFGPVATWLMRRPPRRRDLEAELPPAE